MHLLYVHTAILPERLKINRRLQNYKNAGFVNISVNNQIKPLLIRKLAFFTFILQSLTKINHEICGSSRKHCRRG